MTLISSLVVSKAIETAKQMDSVKVKKMPIKMVTAKPKVILMAITTQITKEI